MKFRIGHPAYPNNGMNGVAWHNSYHSALRGLLSRKVSMKRAHIALQTAIAGSFAIAGRYHKGACAECCEVIADKT
jgi:hypothetical protein